MTILELIELKKDEEESYLENSLSELKDERDAKIEEAFKGEDTAKAITRIMRNE